MSARCPAGWLLGWPDGRAGERIYPAWTGALEGKRLVCRDVRLINGEYFIHNPWKDEVERGFGADILAVEAYILEHGKVAEYGVNVWD